MVTTLVACWALLAVVASPDGPGAQRVPTAILLPTLGDPDLAGFGGAVERVLRQQIDAIPEVDSSATPSLDLEGLQLAVGCVADNDDCLRSVAAQLKVEVVVAAQLDRAGDDLVLSVLQFRGDRTPARRQVVRRTSGSSRESQLLTEIPGIVDELYDRVAPPTYQPQVVAQTSPPPAEAPWWPWAVLGGGGALVVSGLVLGAVASGTESDFGAAPTDSEAQVDQTLDLKDRAEGQATGANVLLVAGLVVAAVGGAALYWTWPAEVTPTVAVGSEQTQVGLHFVWGGGP
ncbi:MAG: hypothetical protein IPG45_29760 [Deltaproteobacteria bacterium]|nr:hypothetical protein [Deltaproteobacteria bacterium]